MTDLILLLQLVVSLLLSIQQNPDLPNVFKEQVFNLSGNTIKIAEEELEQNKISNPVPSPTPILTIPIPVTESTVTSANPPQPVLSANQPIIKTMDIKLEAVNNAPVVLKNESTKIVLFQFNDEAGANDLDRLYNVELNLTSDVPLFNPTVNSAILTKMDDSHYTDTVSYLRGKIMAFNIVPEKEFSEINLTLTISKATFEVCPSGQTCTYSTLPISSSVKLIKNQ